MLYVFILHFSDINSSRVFETGSVGLVETQLFFTPQVTELSPFWERAASSL